MGEMDFWFTLQNVSVLFLLIVIGYAIGKLGVISERGQKDLTSLVLKVTMPATIILAMQQEFSMDKVNNIIHLIFIMILCYIFMGLTSLLLTKVFPSMDPGRKDILRAGTMLSNTSFMGYPIVLALLGEDALFYAVICGGFIFEVVSWTYGVYLIGRNADGGEASLKEALINPGVISIAIGGFLFLTNIRIPEPLYSTMSLLGQATSPLAMLVVGLILSRTDIRDAVKEPSVFAASLLKLVINPLVIIFVLKAFDQSGMNLVIPAILLSMPTAAYVAMFSANTGNDSEYAGQLVFVCSLCSLITIPLITSLL